MLRLINEHSSEYFNLYIKIAGSEEKDFLISLSVFLINSLITDSVSFGYNYSEVG